VRDRKFLLLYDPNLDMNKPPDPLMVVLRSPLLVLDLPRSLPEPVIPSLHLQFHFLRSPTRAFALLPTNIAQSPAWILLLFFASSSVSPSSPSRHSRTHHVWLHTLVNCGCLLLSGGLRSCQALRVTLSSWMPILGNYSVQILCGCCGLIGSIRGNPSTSILSLPPQFRGPRSAIVERSCSDWQVRSIVCGWAGLAGSPGGRSTFIAGQIIQTSGPSSVRVGRYCQAWRLCSVCCASVCQLFLCSTQVCAHLPSSLLGF